MKVDRDVAVHVEKVSQHPVIEFRREDLQKANRTDGLAHPKVFPFAEVKRGRSDEVLCGKARPGHHVVGKTEWFIRVHVEHIMKDPQPVVARQRLGLDPERLEIIEDVCLNAFEFRLCGPKAVRLNPKRDVLLLEKPIVSLGKLVLQHLGILAADVIKGIRTGGNMNGLFELVDVCPLIDEGELDKDRAVEEVQEITPVLKNAGLILVLSELVVDVVETDCFRIEAAVHLADTIPAHLHIGNRLLCRHPCLLCAASLLLCHDDFLLLVSGERITKDPAIADGLFGLIYLFSGAAQYAVPPFHEFHAE